MRPRERIQTVLRHEQPDRVPRMVNFYPTKFGDPPGRPREVEFDTDIRFVRIAEPKERDDFLGYLESLPAEVYVGRRDVLRTVLAEVARGYVELRGAQRRLEVARDNLRIQRQSLELVEAKVETGLARPLELEQARAQLSATRSAVPAFQAQVRAGKRREKHRRDEEPPGRHGHGMGIAQADDVAGLTRSDQSQAEEEENASGNGHGGCPSTEGGADSQVSMCSVLAMISSCRGLFRSQK